MDIERVNSVLIRAIVGFQADEIETMAEAMAAGKTSYDVKAPSGIKSSKPSQTVGGNVIGPFWVMKFSDEVLYFRPVIWRKSGHVKGFTVREEEGRRGARKAVWKTVNKGDRRSWGVVKGKLPPAVQKRFNEKAKDITEKDLDEEG
jgi:hypothetical protein